MRVYVTPCPTAELPLHGSEGISCNLATEIDAYGSDAAHIAELIAAEPGLAEYIDERLDLQRAEVVWFAREEMARTVDDVLSRRCRALILDAAAAIAAAPAVAEILAAELGWSKERQAREVAEFQEIAAGYLPGRFA